MVAGADELRRLGAAEIAGAVGAGELDPVEVVAAHVGELATLDALYAVITRCPEHAADRARAGVAGPLAGVPVLVKDLFDTAGVRTTYGSRIYADHVPDRTAAAVQLLEQAGAIVIGKANLHEFAWGTTSQNPHWGFVQNPVRPGRVAGGSSGGNAAALAAGVSVLGLGTDTAGSLRLPAACCGVVGFKPSHGRVPLEGCMPLAPTFDVAGPMARTVADCALAHSVLARQPVPEPSLDGLVVGVLDRPPRMSPHEPGAVGQPAAASLADEIDRLEALGARVIEADLPEPEADVIPILLAEAAAAHSGTFPSRRDEYGADTQLKWDTARRVPPADVEAARRALPGWRQRALAERTVDLYLSPTLAIDIPSIDVWEPDVRVGMVANTRIFSFLGWAAIAIGGVQLAGPEDAVVLGAALAREQAYGRPSA